MSTIISASIDLTKIDKTRIIQGKNGAQYYNLAIIVNDTKDQYNNDVSVQQGQTKEERAAKAKAVYIGNGKKIWDSAGKSVNNPTFTDGGDNQNLPF